MSFHLILIQASENICLYFRQQLNKDSESITIANYVDI